MNMQELGISTLFAFRPRERLLGKLAQDINVPVPRKRDVGIFL